MSEQRACTPGGGGAPSEERRGRTMVVTTKLASHGEASSMMGRLSFFPKLFSTETATPSGLVIPRHSAGSKGDAGGEGDA